MPFVFSIPLRHGRKMDECERKKLTSIIPTVRVQLTDVQKLRSISVNMHKVCSRVVTGHMHMWGLSWWAGAAGSGVARVRDAIYFFRCASQSQACGCFVWVRVSVCVSVTHMCVCAYIHTCVCVCVCLYMRVYICVCVCVLMHNHVCVSTSTHDTFKLHSEHGYPDAFTSTNLSMYADPFL